ncbi:MAG: PTS sugar transporter subunit IIA [Planctomycetota bacterium]|nr:MAG: PTS sugar transporter subunit IIA [Planctomycetota bacterium]
MKLSELVSSDAIVTDLKSRERDDVVGELVDVLLASSGFDKSLREQLIAKVLEREKMSSTGFGRGVAVPHVKHPSVDRLVAAVGLSRDGVDFNALDKQPVYSIFLLLSPEDRPEEHLQAMETIFKNLRKDTFRRFLRQASTPEEAMTLLREADDQLLTG